MKKKIAVTLSAMTAAATFAVPAGAVETDDADDGHGEARAAAVHARNAARQLETGEADSDLEEGLEDATDALQAVLDKMTNDDIGGNGVAAQVVSALIAGESPAGIGADHGAAMAEQAAQRRAEHTTGRPDHAGPPDDTDEADDTDGDDANEAADTHHSDDSDQPGRRDEIGRPDHAGQRDGSGRPDHAGGPNHSDDGVDGDDMDGA